MPTVRPELRASRFAIAHLIHQVEVNDAPRGFVRQEGQIRIVEAQQALLGETPSSKSAVFLQQGNYVSNSLGVGFAGLELVSEVDCFFGQAPSLTSEAGHCP